MLDWMFTKLGQKHVWVYGYKTYGSKYSPRVIGVKNINHILANFQISERGTNERKKFKKRNIPKFPIHYYTKIAAKTGTHDKIILFFASKRGTVPPKEEQLASM